MWNAEKSEPLQLRRETERHNSTSSRLGRLRQSHSTVARRKADLCAPSYRRSVFAPGESPPRFAFPLYQSQSVVTGCSTTGVPVLNPSVQSPLWRAMHLLASSGRRPVSCTLCSQRCQSRALLDDSRPYFLESSFGQTRQSSPRYACRRGSSRRVHTVHSAVDPPGSGPRSLTFAARWTARGASRSSRDLHDLFTLAGASEVDPLVHSLRLPGFLDRPPSGALIVSVTFHILPRPSSAHARSSQTYTYAYPTWLDTTGEVAVSRRA